MLKKIITVILSALIVVVVFFLNATPIFNEHVEALELYTSLGSDGLIVKADEKILLGRIKGESFRCESDFDYLKFINEYDGEILKVEKIPQGVSYYCYTDKIKYSKEFNGKKINLHVFVGENSVTVGSPVIFGSF